VSYDDEAAGGVDIATDAKTMIRFLALRASRRERVPESLIRYL
jgi:hypothetical protein